MTKPAAGSKPRGQESPATTEAVPLGPDIIHSVTDRIPRFSGAIHVYGGDFFGTAAVLRRTPLGGDIGPPAFASGRMGTGDALREQAKLGGHPSWYWLRAASGQQHHSDNVRSTSASTLAAALLSTAADEREVPNPDMRNPLGRIRPSLSFVRQTAGGQSDRLDRALECMDPCVDRCTAIIADLRETSDPPELRRVPTDIDDWLAERLRDQAKHHVVRIEADSGAEDTVAIDPERFAHVIDRVIDNAIQAMDGPIWHPARDHPRLVTVATELAGPHVRLVVSDTGPGIGAWVLPKIFDPLFTTRGFGGDVASEDLPMKLVLRAPSSADAIPNLLRGAMQPG